MLWQNEMPLSELEIRSLHFVLPKHKRDQFSLLWVICVEELPHRARCDGLEVSVQENCCLSFQEQSVALLLLGGKAHWKRGRISTDSCTSCIKCSVLCWCLLQVIVTLTWQLYVVECLGVVKVFTICLCSLTWWGPGFGWGLLRSSEMQMMSRSSLPL